MKFSLSWVTLAALLFGAFVCPAVTLESDGYHVFPGDSIQDALERAARNETNKVVHVHAGEYHPRFVGQALIWFNRLHEGIHLEAIGDVTLSAANPHGGNRHDPGYPAMVNHVVYFGDGVTSNTVLRGFRITGANHFVTGKGADLTEPDTTIKKNSFFFTDGGGIKVFGRSSPTLQDIELDDNYTSPCAAGISIQQEGFDQNPVLIENCVLRGNRAQITGSAIDLLQGSAARIINCLLVSNVSNMGEDFIAKELGGVSFSNSGVVTIFWKSRAEFRNCTFTANRNAVDDLGGASTYTDCIFADDLLAEGLPGTTRYEVDVSAGAVISGCIFRGTVIDPHHTVSEKNNVLNAPPPLFDANYVPTAEEYKQAGYRPAPAVAPPK